MSKTSETPTGDGQKSRRRVVYRCCGCGLEFAPSIPGVAPCPRCSAVGGHEAIDTVERGSRIDGV